MKLEELFQKVKEKELSKEQLEEYRDDLVGLFGQMCIEMAELKKKEALFYLNEKKETDVATRRAWDSTADGRREIELKYYMKASEKMISSTRDRLYRLY